MDGREGALACVITMAWLCNCVCMCSPSSAVAELALSQKGDVFVSWNAEVVVSQCKDRTVTGERVGVRVRVCACVR